MHREGKRMGICSNKTVRRCMNAATEDRGYKWSNGVYVSDRVDKVPNYEPKLTSKWSKSDHRHTYKPLRDSKCFRDNYGDAY